MGPEDSKSYQLRVRVTAEERDLLEKLRTERNRGETISDLVREAISLLVKPGGRRKNGRAQPRRPGPAWIAWPNCSNGNRCRSRKPASRAFST